MNQLLAHYLVTALSSLNGPVISRLAGLVKTLETDRFTSGKTAKFPIPLDATPSTCAKSGKAFPDLVMDGKERLIVYFEDFGNTNNNGKWISKLRLIAWGNNTLFSGISEATVTPLLIAKISKLLERNIVAGYASPIGSLHCSVVGSPAADTNLFSRYTYNETSSQYLLPPYFAFGLDLSLTYVLNDNCIDITGLPVAQCA